MRDERTRHRREAAGKKNERDRLKGNARRDARRCWVSLIVQEWPQKKSNQLVHIRMGREGAWHERREPNSKWACIVVYGVSISNGATKESEGIL